MENYVLIYHFGDKANQQQFENKIYGSFPRHQTEENQGVTYFGFADREEPGVVDKVETIIHPMRLGTEDFVALYYTRNGNDDQIKRRMIFGSASLVDSKMEDKGFDAHRNSLTKLLDFDYVKAFPQPS